MPLQVYVELCHHSGELACAVLENGKVIASLLELQRQQGAPLLHALHFDCSCCTSVLRWCLQQGQLWRHSAWLVTYNSRSSSSSTVGAAVLGASSQGSGRTSLRPVQLTQRQTRRSGCSFLQPSNSTWPD